MYQDSISGSGEAQYNFSGWKLVACNCWHNGTIPNQKKIWVNAWIMFVASLSPGKSHRCSIGWLRSQGMFGSDHQIWHKITRFGTKSPGLAPDHQMLQTFCIFTQSITTISHQTPIMAFHNLCNWKQCLHTWPHIVGMLWKVATSRSFCFFQYRQVSWVQP